VSRQTKVKSIPAGKVVVHSDIIIDFLIHQKPSKSVLRQLLQTYFCYTTVFNAIELFSLARTKDEQTKIEDAMSSMKILGLNAKNAQAYGTLFADKMNVPRMNVLIAGLCLESKLPIVTNHPNEFKGVKRLVVLTPSMAGVTR